jgi:hypothetical protein
MERCLIQHRDNFIFLPPLYYPTISFLIFLVTTFYKVPLSNYKSWASNPLQFHYFTDTKYTKYIKYTKHLTQNTKSATLMSILFPYTCNVHSSLKVRDHTSQPYKKSCKTMLD